MMFGRQPQSAEADTLGRLIQRVEALEERCRALAQALEARDADSEKLRLDQVVLGKRLDEAQTQSRKAVAGLFDRFETLRARSRTAGPTPPAASDVSATPPRKQL